MEDDGGYTGRLRKRKRAVGDGGEQVLKHLLQLMEGSGKVVIWSGSGLSANSGMSMFTTKNGLYERARSKFKIQDGMKLFSYPFYKQRRKDLQAFFAQIYSEAQSSRAAPGHVAIAELHKMGRLQRHYTLNIDGLAAAVGMDTWHHEHNPEGSTVEMHGNISYVVCPSCHAVEPLTGSVMETMKACQPVMCKACNEDEMRFKVMLYDDEQGDCITPEDVFERLDHDLAVAGAVIWVGISFEQSASTEYFRKVRHMLASHGRLHEVTQVILNPSEEPYFNVISTMSNKEDVKVLDVRATSDDALPRIVQHLHELGGTSPDSAAVKAAAEAATAAAEAKRRRQEEQQAAAAAAAAAATAADGHLTPSASGGRRRRSSMATTASPGEHGGAAVAKTVCPGFPAKSASLQELASLDSAAAAALALPEAVQKHLEQMQQKQQQQQRQQEGVGNGAETAGNGAEGAAAETQQQLANGDLQEQQWREAAAAAAAAASTTPKRRNGVSAQAAEQQANGFHAPAAPAVPQQQQQPAALVGSQQLLGQLQAVHALQAALAQPHVQQRPPPAAAAAAGPALLVPQVLHALLAGQQQSPGISPLLATALLAGQRAGLAPGAAAAAAAAAQAARLQATQPAAAAAPSGAAGSSSALAALLASNPAAAVLLASNPALLASLAGNPSAQHGNGPSAVQQPLPDTQAAAATGAAAAAQGADDGQGVAAAAAQCSSPQPAPGTQQQPQPASEQQQPTSPQHGAATASHDDAPPAPVAVEPTVKQELEGGTGAADATAGLQGAATSKSMPVANGAVGEQHKTEDTQQGLAEQQAAMHCDQKQ